MHTHEQEHPCKPMHVYKMTNHVATKDFTLKHTVYNNQTIIVIMCFICMPFIFYIAIHIM